MDKTAMKHPKKNNDKNSLCWRENIGETALYVNGKVSTTYALLGLGYGWEGFRRISRAGRHIFTAMEFIRLRQNTLQLAAGMNGGANRVEAL